MTMTYIYIKKKLIDIKDQIKGFLEDRKSVV